MCNEAKLDLRFAQIQGNDPQRNAPIARPIRGPHSAKRLFDDLRKAKSRMRETGIAK